MTKLAVIAGLMLAVLATSAAEAQQRRRQQPAGPQGQFDVEQVAITAGRLVITGRTARPNQVIELVNSGDKTASLPNRRFSFSLSYLPETCKINLKVENDELKDLLVSSCIPRGAGAPGKGRQRRQGWQRRQGRTRRQGGQRRDLLRQPAGRRHHVPLLDQRHHRAVVHQGLSGAEQPHGRAHRAGPRGRRQQAQRHRAAGSAEDGKDRRARRHAIGRVRQGQALPRQSRDQSARRRPRRDRGGLQVDCLEG